jgi:hypothetical protein
LEKDYEENEGLSQEKMCRIRDPRCRKIVFRIPDPGGKKAPDPGPQHCLTHLPYRVLKEISRLPPLLPGEKF